MTRYEPFEKKGDKRQLRWPSDGWKRRLLQKSAAGATRFQVEGRIYPRQKREGSRRAARTRLRCVKGLTLCELRRKIPTAREPAIYQRRMVQTAGFVSSTEVGPTKNGTLARINGWL